VCVCVSLTGSRYIRRQTLTPTPAPSPVSSPFLTVPESNAYLTAVRDRALTVTASILNSFRMQEAVFAFLFHAQRANAAYYNEMKCNLHLNTHLHPLTHIQYEKKAVKKALKACRVSVAILRKLNWTKKVKC